MKKIIGIFCVIAIVASLVSIGYASTNTQIETTTSEAYIPSETSTTTINSLLADNERINTNNIEKLEKLINESSKRMKAAKKMEKSACDLGYEKNHCGYRWPLFLWKEHDGQVIGSQCRLCLCRYRRHVSCRHPFCHASWAVCRRRLGRCRCS